MAIESGVRGFLTYEGDPLEQNLQRPDAPVGMLIMSYKNRRRYRLVLFVTFVRRSLQLSAFRASVSEPLAEFLVFLDCHANTGQAFSPSAANSSSF